MKHDIARARLGLTLAMVLAGCGGEEGASAPAPGPTIAAPSPTPTPVADAPRPCRAGTWRAVAADPNDGINSQLPAQFETAHFVVRFKDGVATDADARAAGDHLEAVWTRFTGEVKFPEPYCADADKLKTNVFVGEGYGLSGGGDGQGHMGMWIGPGALRDRFGLSHEFAHALQFSSGGLRDSPYVGWMWESHANWMAHQLPEFRGFTHCSIFLKEYPHLYYGSTRNRYCNWQFLEHLKNRFGYQAVADIWGKAPGPQDPARHTADPFTIIMRNRGWTLAQLNDAFGEWAMRAANWDYTNPDGTDQGAVYRANYGGYDQTTDANILAATVLDPIDLAQRRFAVPDYWAPQRWGYNIVKLYADRGAASVTATFRGVVQQASAVSSFAGLANEPDTIPVPGSDWRWGLVAVGADGKSRYTPLQRGADGETSIAVRDDDRGLYLIVTATPTQMQQIRWDQPFYSIYRYPWMVQFAGAMPERYQPGAPQPIFGGHRHPNGGGWVGPDAQVAATAYVGPYARVFSGVVGPRARIEDHAVVLDRAQVLDDGVIAGLTVLRGNTIVRDRARAATTFLGLGEYEQNIVLSGTAQNIGDVEQRGASFSTGMFYGLVLQHWGDDRDQGAELTAPVPEVTARPAYLWR